MEKIEIRKATIDDAETILYFIKELAIYEKEPDAVKATLSDIKQTIFSQQAKTNAIICFSNGKPIGFAVYFYNYSTWLGRNGLYLEDLFVLPEYRGIGAGKAILKYLAKQAVNEGCGRFEWCVLNWNQPAIDFYESIGAKPLSEWTTYRLSGEALSAFADKP